MPRFKDENDFPDVETLSVDRRDFSSEAVWSSKASPWLANEPEAGSDLIFDKSGPTRSNAVQSRKLDEPGDIDNPFVTIDRSDDMRRTILPRSNRWPSTLWGTSARTHVKNVSAPRFADPSQVLPCIDRHTRREVLFAKRRAGGAGSRRRKRRGPWSGLRC